MENMKNPVFLIAVSFILGFFFWALLGPESIAGVMQGALASTISYFGWFYLMAMLGFLLFAGYAAFSGFGNIRIGGKDAVPAFSRISWFAMLFAAGMGIGLVFWGAAEPISHFAGPPPGTEANSPQAARAALRYAFFHWGLHPWAAYCVVALALGFSQFNRGRPMLISSAFVPLLGDRAKGFLGKSIDVLALIATLFGVVTSLGFGALQIGSGLQKIFGLPNTLSLQLAVIGVATVLFLASALSGLTKGIRILSNTNLVLAAVLTFTVFIFGPTAFILDAFTTTLGDYTNNLVSMSLRMTPFSRGEWVADWTLFYWAWWVAWAPFVGMFIARISLGRTIRELVTGVLLVPSMASFLWFSVFGGTALFQAMFEQRPLVEINSQDVSMTLFALLETLPLGGILSVIAVALVIIFFVTSADSATFVLAMMSSLGDPSPKGAIKVIWGLMIALTAAILLASGGLKGLQTMSILSALPFTALMLLMCFSLTRELRHDLEKEKKERRLRDEKIDQLIRSSKGE